MMSAPSTLCMRPPGAGRTRQLAAQDHIQGTAADQPLPLAHRRDHRRRPRPPPSPARPNHMITGSTEPLLGMAHCLAFLWRVVAVGGRKSAAAFPAVL